MITEFAGSKTKKYLGIFLLLTLVTTLAASGCASGNSPQAPRISPEISTQSPDRASETSFPENEPSQPESAEYTPTPDNRLPPQDWQDWPVVPSLSPKMVAVYNEGIQLGNREDAFSKVGDCQIIPEVFLNIFDDIKYTLPEGMEHLEGTLERFQGSFAREGYALKGGFVFPTVFSPLRADSSVCEPGETPYECELRVHQPSFVLISMEFRYDGRTAETHEKYLRRAVEYALDQGIVPILATKADNFEGDHSLNLTTAKIAYEYDLPLWNYWRAVQYLPGHGIDWERDSYGFHVTPEAWLVRSETFLQVLDSLVKDLQNGSEQSAANPQPTPTSESQSNPQKTTTFEQNTQPRQQVDQDIAWEDGQLIFDIKERGFGELNQLGIYTLDIHSGELTQVSGTDFQLLGISPDYQLLLVSSGSNLSIIHPDGETAGIISTTLYANSPSAAVWDRGSNLIYYLSQENDETVLFRYNPELGTHDSVTRSDPALVLAASDGKVAWGQGSCNTLGDCKIKTIHWADHADPQTATREFGDAILLPCQTVTEFVYAERADSGALSLHIQSLDTNDEIVFWALNTEYSDCAWSPDHQQVAVTLIDRGWYSGVIQEHYFQLLKLDTHQVRDLSFLLDQMDRLRWSPDGSHLAFSGTSNNEEVYRISLNILKLDTLEVIRRDHLSAFESENYLAINHLFWLP